MMTNDEIKQYEGQRNKRILSAAMGLVGIFIAVTFSIMYSAYTNEKNDQRWCSLMVSLDDRYQALPKENVNPDAARFASQIHTLRHEFKCSDSSAPPAPSQSPKPSAT